MRTEADDKLDREFRAALAAAVNGTPLLAGDTGADASWVSLPWIADARLPDGGYWVGFGLRHYDARPASTWPTFIFVQYRDEGPVEGHTRPLDIDLSGDSARDARMMAALVVAAVLPDVERRLAQAGVRS
jgi:hypothetical protein